MVKKPLCLFYSISIIIGIIINVDNVIRDDTVLILKTVFVLQGLEGAARLVAGSSVVLIGILHVIVPY